MCLPIRSCIQPDNTHTHVLQWLCLARQPQTTLSNNVTLNLRGSGGYSTGDRHEIQALYRPSQRRPFGVGLKLTVKTEHLHARLRDALKELAAKHFEGRRFRTRYIPLGLD